jgi:ABC-2 type transport system permease protein
VVTGVAFSLGWQPEASGWLLGLALLVLGAAAFTAIGLLVAGTVRPEATLAITNLLWILLGALGGIVIPAERLPSLAQDTVHMLPSGALGEGLRDAFLHGTLNGNAVLVLLLWLVLAGAAAIRWFKWN